MISRVQDNRSIQMELDALVKEKSFSDMVMYYVQEALEKLPEVKEPVELICPGCSAPVSVKIDKIWNDEYRALISCPLCGHSIMETGLNAPLAEIRLMEVYLKEIEDMDVVVSYDDEDDDYDDEF